MVKLKILENTNLDISEKEIQELFEQNLESIESGLKYAGSYIHIGTGIIDILAVDEGNTPVIIECKKVGNFDKDALIQLMNYYSWFASNANNLRHLFDILAKNGFTDPAQSIRLIALVSDVSDDVKNACWALHPSMMLVSFSLFSSPNGGEEVIVAPKVILDTSVGGELFINQPKIEDDHFKSNPHMRPLYEKLKKAILEIDKSIRVNPSPQDYIAFSGKKNFCCVHVKKNWLRLDLGLSSDEANTPRYTWNEKWESWGGYYHLESESGLEEALSLVKKSYDKAG